MLRLTLRRLADSPDGTTGRILGLDSGVLYTLEEEWRNNEANESRIPAGTYICRRTVYQKHNYETFEITGVPNRNRILFHPGNTEEDTQGCVLLGTGIGPLEVTDEETGERRRKIAVTGSKAAFRLFMGTLLGVDEFELTITDPEYHV